eukprot:381548_1
MFFAWHFTGTETDNNNSILKLPHNVNNNTSSVNIYKSSNVTPMPIRTRIRKTNNSLSKKSCNRTKSKHAVNPKQFDQTRVKLPERHYNHKQSKSKRKPVGYQKNSSMKNQHA